MTAHQQPSYTSEEICKIQRLFDNSNLEELFTERGQKYGRCFIKKKKQTNNKGIIVVLEFIKPTITKFKRKRQDQAQKLTRL